ncbi:MAG: hypothetical protein ACI9JT_002406, partial [Polaribacter sp.]
MALLSMNTIFLKFLILKFKRKYHSIFLPNEFPLFATDLSQYQNDRKNICNVSLHL